MVRSKPAGQRLKVQHARQAVSVTMDLLGIDLLEASLWLAVRQAQDPQRAFEFARAGRLDRAAQARVADAGSRQHPVGEDDRCRVREQHAGFGLVRRGRAAG